VHFFELHRNCMPELRLDNRENIAAHLASPEPPSTGHCRLESDAGLRGARSDLI
jgi:hypothetical protein